MRPFSICDIFNAFLYVPIVLDLFNFLIVDCSLKTGSVSVHTAHPLIYANDKILDGIAY